ncbi:MAG: D-alanine--D-alanine ligase [Bacteroidetes bacterium]|nr:D-alanine--D-alanine ligase [Bacteroidota bacterium]
MNWFQRVANRPFFIRLFHWEYWSFNTIYIPIYIIWIWLCLRARSFFFFAAANPKIKNGGFLNESKKDIFPLIPAGVHPKTIFFSTPSNVDMVLSDLKKNGLHFPLIGKPDIGGRGRGVKALRDEQDVKEYLKMAFLDFHIQEFVPYKNEVGIFYYRYPGKSNGSISGIVGKEFLKVIGDGVSSIKQLLLKDKRAILQLENLQETNPDLLLTVLPAGEERVIVPYGNHARGAKFLDYSDRVNEKLTVTIDRICKMIPEFYFGRLDIRFSSWEELEQGLNFSIIEVNGAGSEPTHIYDPRHSVFFAWKEIVRHWVILWRISRMNHKLGIPYLTMKEGIQMFKEDKLNSEKLAAMKV